MHGTDTEFIPETVVHARQDQGLRTELIATRGAIELIHVKDLPGNIGIHIQRLLLNRQVLAGRQIHRQHPDIKLPDLVNNRHLEMQASL